VVDLGKRARVRRCERSGDQGHHGSMDLVECAGGHAGHVLKADVVRVRRVGGDDVIHDGGILDIHRDHDLAHAARHDSTLWTK